MATTAATAKTRNEWRKLLAARVGCGVANSFIAYHDRCAEACAAAAAAGEDGAATAATAEDVESAFESLIAGIDDWDTAQRQQMVDEFLRSGCVTQEMFRRALEEQRQAMGVAEADVGHVTLQTYLYEVYQHSADVLLDDISDALRRQRTFAGRLATIAEDVLRAQVGTPAAIKPDVPA